jgi:hypothetical protein
MFGAAMAQDSESQTGRKGGPRLLAVLNQVEIGMDGRNLKQLGLAQVQQGVRREITVTVLNGLGDVR